MKRKEPQRLRWPHILNTLLLSMAVCLAVCACSSGAASSKSASSASSGTTATRTTTRGTTSQETKTVSEDDDQASADAAADAAEDEAAPVDPAPVEVPRLPEKGMSADLIDATELGAHDEASEPLASGKWKGGTVYYWRSKNGKDDRVFSATVVDGEVAAVKKWNTSLNYWADGTTLGKDFPDVYASGEKVEKKTAAPKLPDPLDYSDAYEFADDAEAYFKYQGSDDPYNDALDYWDENAA